MTSKIPSRKFEALSAYLDGELSPKSRQRLERELQSDKALRTALRDMQNTRAVLRSTPKLRAPQNFTLSQAYAGIQTRQRSSMRVYGTLRLASALATILLVVVLVGEWYAGTRQPAMAPMVQDVMIAPAEITTMVNEQAVEAVEKSVMPRTAPSPELEAESYAEEPVMEAAAPIESGAIQKASPSPTLIRSLTAKPSMTQVPTVTYTPPPVAAVTSRGPDFLRVLQISLAVVAITAGITAIFVRRSAQRH